MTMIEQHACVCGFPLMETPAFPRLFSYRWHVMHKKVHLANYPEKDNCHSVEDRLAYLERRMIELVGRPEDEIARRAHLDQLYASIHESAAESQKIFDKWESRGHD